MHHLKHHTYRILHRPYLFFALFDILNRFSIEEIDTILSLEQEFKDI